MLIIKHNRQNGKIVLHAGTFADNHSFITNEKKLLLRIFAIVAITVALIVGAGLSGISFYVWPTGINDQNLAITPDVIQRLQVLKAESKFGPDITTFYPGANEKDRLVAQAAVDATIQSLIAELPARPQRSTVLRAMKSALADFDIAESEERDQILMYFTKMLDICGVEDSGELFNVWRYGFPYGWLF